MRETLDIAIANDWFAVGSSEKLAPGATQEVQLLGRRCQLRRSKSGEITAFDSEAGQRYAAAEHCGCIWTCLGDDPRPLFALPEFADPERRFIYMGAIGLHTGGLRVVENFLDMAHFPYVHAHILGSEPVTEVRPYDVHFDHATGELWVRGCKFVQPLASASADGEADVNYVYRVVNPFTPLLYKGLASEPDRQDIIFLAVQPLTEETCVAHFTISLFDRISTDAEITHFQQTILAQDKPILEGHVHKKLPLLAGMEIPTRADAGSTAYRNWLRSIGLRFGVLSDRGSHAGLMRVEVVRKWDAALDVAAFQLRATDGRQLPAADPGAHVDVYLPNGIVRSYSICNAGDGAVEYQIAVKREPESRGGSAAMHALTAGCVLDIQQPRNNFPLVQATHSVLLAGGIGITPLMAMARVLAAHGRSLELHYFCRSLEHAAFAEDLGRLLGDRFVLHIGMTPAQTEVLIDEVLAAAPAGTHTYACGPTAFMHLVEVLAVGPSWPQGTVHFEYFQAPAAVDTSGEVFEVRLARSGASAKVYPGQTLAAALRASGAPIETHCEQGVCGTCVCGVLDGAPDHRDFYLTPDERAAGKQIVPCVSRSLSPVLVLDL